MVAMKKIIYFLIIPAIAIGAFLNESLHNQRSGADKVVTQAASEQQDSTWESEEEPYPVTPGTVRIGEDRQQTAGIRIGEVERKPMTQTIRSAGNGGRRRDQGLFHQRDSRRLDHQNLPEYYRGACKKRRDPGNILQPRVSFGRPGSALCLGLYGPDSIKRAALESQVRQDQMDQFNVNLQQYKDSLRNLGMGDLQIKEMIRTRRYMENVNITAPADGFILSP